MASSDFPADISGESVRSSISMVILYDTEPATAHVVIPADILAILPVAPEAEAAVVASHAGVLDLVIHSTLETDPLEDPPSSEHAPIAPVISPFLFSDHSEPDSESEPSADSA
ncbi:hypothetical protein Tco_0310101, partial [Tanacetum coccineum]